MLSQSQLEASLAKVVTLNDLSGELSYATSMNDSNSELVSFANCYFGMVMFSKAENKLLSSSTSSLWHKCKEVTVSNFAKYLGLGDGIAMTKERLKERLDNFVLLVQTNYGQHKNIAATIRELEKSYLGIKENGQFSRIQSKVLTYYDNQVFKPIAVTAISPNPFWLKNPLAFYFLVFFIRLAPYYDTTKNMQNNLEKLGNLPVFDGFDKNVTQNRQAFPVLWYAYKNGLNSMLASSKAEFDKNAWGVASYASTFGPSAVGDSIQRYRFGTRKYSSVTNTDPYIEKLKSVLSEKFFKKVTGQDLNKDSSFRTRYAGFWPDNIGKTISVFLRK